MLGEGSEVLPTPLNLGRLMTLPMPRPRWAIPNLCLRGEVTFLYGCPGTGKSTLYQEALVAHETGRAFLDFLPFEEEQKFVVFDWESSVEQVARAFKRLGLPPKDPATFTYYPPLLGLCLDQESGREVVRCLLEVHNATCVIFDNRDAAFPNTIETEGGPVAEAMQATKELASELETAILLVSHEPKSQYESGTAKLRGHTAWAAHADQLFRLKPRQGCSFCREEVVLAQRRPRG
jgi:RecA-family ATPase